MKQEMILTHTRQIPIKQFICKKYLSHFQKSVFRGEMTPSKFIQLRKDLNQVIDKNEDFICIIKLMNDNVFGEEVLGNGGEVTGESLMI